MAVGLGIPLAIAVSVNPPGSVAAFVAAGENSKMELASHASR